MELIGDFVEDDGLKFSNSTYKSYTSYYNNHFDWQYSSKYDYLDDFDYNYKDEKDTTLFNYNLDMLEPSDWIQFKSGNIKQVGKNAYYIDIQTNNLYEEISNGEFDLIGEDIIVYNKNFEEIY